MPYLTSIVLTSHAPHAPLPFMPYLMPPPPSAPPLLPCMPSPRPTPRALTHPTLHTALCRAAHRCHELTCCAVQGCPLTPRSYMLCCAGLPTDATILMWHFKGRQAALQVCGVGRWGGWGGVGWHGLRWGALKVCDTEGRDGAGCVGGCRMGQGRAGQGRAGQVVMAVAL